MRSTTPALVLVVLGLPAAAQDTGTRPLLELHPGEQCFRSEGRPAFVLGRKPAGMAPGEYDDHFRHAAAAGERFMRIHFTFIPPNEKAGEIDPGMLQPWDAILDAAE